MLGISPNTVGKLLNSQFLPDLLSTHVIALANAPQVGVVEGLLPVLRTAAVARPERAGDTRDFIGDSPTLSDPQFLEASRQWWRCDAGAIVNAGILPVAVAGWVTGVLDIQGVETTERFGPTEVRHALTAQVAGRVGVLHDRSTYRVLTKDATLAVLTEQLLGARVQAAVSGGPIAYLSA
ncbi:hypothetical protein AB0H82_10570 [Streptomyces sp. NPDC050732]|uniref:hypothetical protein n=1 Tax=Streptomyces sp. NPDC050732 TaxID=3154632 RepID=UPI003447C5F0